MSQDPSSAQESAASERAVPVWSTIDWLAYAIAVAASVAMLRFQVAMPWVLGVSAAGGAAGFVLLGPG